jgi:DNA helicase-2/ATP-dependent DNA helicase PcrA
MEERRLFYVAVTRAKRKLTLTWAKERGLGTMKSRRLPSRFLSELPTDLCTNNENQITSQARLEVRKEKTLSTLQNLRASLKKNQKN